MITDRWIPRLIVLGYLIMLTVLGGFTVLAFSSQTGFTPNVTVPEASPDWQVTARLNAGRIEVEARDTAGHPISALSVRGVASPRDGGTPQPLRFIEDGAGRRVAPWTGIGAWRAQITLRQGARVHDLRLDLVGVTP